jgi:hypothetical protein
MSPRVAVAFVWALLLALVLATTGCCHVRPWERENLARIEGQLDRHAALRTYENHMWMVREGALGGSGTPGGGCGCN